MPAVLELDSMSAEICLPVSILKPHSMHSTAPGVSSAAQFSHVGPRVTPLTLASSSKSIIGFIRGADALDAEALGF